MSLFKKNGNSSSELNVKNDIKSNEKNTIPETKVKTMISMQKSRGKFINAYEMDAYILSLLFNYRVLDGKKCGFPDSSLEKVKKTLEENSISYQISYPDRDPYIMKFDNNRYEEFKEKAVNKMDYKLKVEKICNYLKDASDEDVDKVLGVLEKLCIK